jgi:rubrerythrin
MDVNFEVSQTRVNLRSAFYEEAALASRFSYFAIVAEFEGKAELARKFKSYAESSSLNAHGILDFLRVDQDPASEIPIRESRENIDSILHTESKQSLETYVEMAKVAREEGYTDIASWFDTLEKLKASHVGKLQELKNE